MLKVNILSQCIDIFLKGLPPQLGDMTYRMGLFAYKSFIDCNISC